MSTSLKVVRIAAVCCASTSRRATVSPQRRHRHHALARAVDAGRAAPRRQRRPTRACARRGRRRRRGRRALLEARITSCLEMRPPRPLPLTSSGAIPLSAIARRADGAARTLPPLRRLAGGAAAGAGLRRLTRGSPWPAVRRGPIWSISAITSPTATVSPALRRILRRMPAPGEGTSSVAFSLSTSTSGSSAVTSSPSARFQAPSVASRTDSPSAGTAQRQRHLARSCPNASAISRACSRVCRFADPVAGLADSGRLTHDHGKRPRQQPRQLAVHVRPGAHVLRLLLNPDDGRPLGERRQRLEEVVLAQADTAARRARWPRHRSRAPRASRPRS